jgi:hypothetical protein
VIAVGLIKWRADEGEKKGEKKTGKIPSRLGVDEECSSEAEDAIAGVGTVAHADHDDALCIAA